MRDITIHTDVQKTYDAMLRVCAEAETEIIFEQYIFNDYYPEGIAGEFIEVFLKRAQNGVQVILYLDSIGSLGISANARLREKLIDAGIKLYFYESTRFLEWLSPARIFLRDHRKVLVIDQTQTWIGGVVVGDTYRTWNDLMVQIIDPELAYATHHHVVDQVNKYTDNKPFRFDPICVNSETQLIGNSPGFSRRHISAELYRRTKSAKDHIIIVTPYFAPTFPMWLELVRARRRGVTITIIIPETTDHAFIDTVHKGYFSACKRHGFNLYLHPNMLHAKLITIDDWVTFGSTNFDQLSLIFNHELNLATTNNAMVNALQTYTDDLIAKSKQLTDTMMEATFFEKIKINLYKVLRIIT